MSDRFFPWTFDTAETGEKTPEENVVSDWEAAAESTSDEVPIPHLAAVGSKITLQVGEQTFITTATTLTEESGFFSSLLSGRWDNTQPDGSYFIDADPDLFKHILRYLRRGVLPIFYDSGKGHDHALYLALLEEAKYFQIPRLEEWLGGKAYIRAVKVTRTVIEKEGVDDLDEITDADVDITLFPSWTTRKVYVCPRDIVVHRGNPRACGRACKRVQGDADDEYVEEPLLRTVMVRRRIFLDREACTEGR
ncbi:hypothetical protein AOQ84DRAFT_345683 [Glonium stellatum]|uniref:BTB domain-containing protein n=1 Tax=Glonium stellatum TaxID=574774 RepID=A0A8E2EUA5_9PEZI|nr:hypothetical protein AOQ84DRAFT_345683 [Glonium stellatum]